MSDNKIKKLQQIVLSTKQYMALQISAAKLATDLAGRCKKNARLCRAARTAVYVAKLAIEKAILAQSDLDAILKPKNKQKNKQKIDDHDYSDSVPMDIADETDGCCLY